MKDFWHGLSAYLSVFSLAFSVLCFVVGFLDERPGLFIVGFIFLVIVFLIFPTEKRTRS